MRSQNNSPHPSHHTAKPPSPRPMRTQKVSSRPSHHTAKPPSPRPMQSQNNSPRPSPRPPRPSYTYGSLPMQHEARPCPRDREVFHLHWPPTLLFSSAPNALRPGKCLRTKDMTIHRNWMVEEGTRQSFVSDTMRYSPRKVRDALPKPDDYHTAGFLMPLRFEGCPLSPPHKENLSTNDVQNNYSRPLSGVRDRRNSRTFTRIVGTSSQRVSDMAPQHSTLPLVNFTPRASYIAPSPRTPGPSKIVRQINGGF